jgi:hypothetical protein
MDIVAACKGWLRSGVMAAVVVLACVGGARSALAQEVVAKEVDLSSSLFTIEDLENLDAAVSLSKDQREAALELMRGGMARARAIALRSARKVMDMEEDEMETFDAEDMEKFQKRMEEFQESEKKKNEELLAVEKGVMEELKLLLEGAQAEEGWAKFERSRRRLLLQGVVQTVAMAAQSGDDPYGGMGMMMGMSGGMPELVGTLRASKLGSEDIKAIAEPLEMYETTMDTLVKEYRSLASPLLTKGSGGIYGMAMAFAQDGEAKPGVDGEKLKDLMQRMRVTHVRHARMVEEKLSGDARERFVRQRLRQEFQWRWQPSRRDPQVRAVLRLRSLTELQKAEMDRLIKATDSKLIESAAKGLAKQDEDVLSDKKSDPENPWADMQSPEAMERAKDEAKLRKQLAKDVVALLNESQRNAFETGIENDDDLKTQFEKRRHGQSVWERMGEMYGEDYNPWGMSDDEEEVP